MDPKTPAQRLLALVLLATLTALSGTIPVLDVMVGDGKAAVEAEHLPGTHGFPHNHLLCIQHQANQWVPECESPAPSLLGVVSLPAFPKADLLTDSGQILLPLARAPPTA